MTIDRHFRRYLALAIGTTALITAIPTAVQASVNNPNASSVISALKTAIAKESGVHLVVTSKSGSNSSIATVDIGKTDGIEKITSGKESIKLVVTPDYAYLSGSPTGLTTIVGLTSAQQKKVGNDSISMKKGTSQYSDLEAGVTNEYLISMLPAAKGTTYSTTKSGSTSYYVLTWTTAATSTTPKLKNVLTISTAKTTLPVKETVTASTGSGTTVFSKWGEKVTVSAPKSSSTITYAKVTAS